MMIDVANDGGITAMFGIWKLSNLTAISRVESETTPHMAPNDINPANACGEGHFTHLFVEAQLNKAINKTTTRKLHTHEKTCRPYMLISESVGFSSYNVHSLQKTRIAIQASKCKESTKTLDLTNSPQTSC